MHFGVVREQSVEVVLQVLEELVLLEEALHVLVVLLRAHVVRSLHDLLDLRVLVHQVLVLLHLLHVVLQVRRPDLAQLLCGDAIFTLGRVQLGVGILPHDGAKVFENFGIVYNFNSVLQLLNFLVFPPLIRVALLLELDLPLCYLWRAVGDKVVRVLRLLLFSIKVKPLFQLRKFQF